MSHGGGPPYGRDPFSNGRGGRIRGQGGNYYPAGGEMPPFHDYPPPRQGVVGRHGGVSSEIYHRESILLEERGLNGYPNFGRPDQGRFQPPSAHTLRPKLDYRPPPHEFDGGYSDQNRGFHADRHDVDLLPGDYGRGIRSDEGRRLNQSRVTQPPPGWNSYEDGSHSMRSSSFHHHPPVAHSYHQSMQSTCPSVHPSFSSRGLVNRTQQFETLPPPTFDPRNDLREERGLNGGMRFGFDRNRRESQPLPDYAGSLPPDWIGKALFVTTTVLCVVYCKLSHYLFQSCLQHSKIQTQATRIMQMR